MGASKTEGEYWNREEGRLMAKVAQQAERFEDMVMYMRGVISLADAEGTDPSPEEKTLLSAAYKGAVNARRAAWQVVVAAIEAAEKEKKGDITDTASSDLAAPHKLLFLHRKPSDEYVDASDLLDTDSLSCCLSHETQSDDNDQPDTLEMSRIRLGRAMDPQNLQSGHAGDIHDDSDGPPVTILQGNAPDNFLELLARYRKILEGEIYRRCRDLVKLLDKHVHAEEPESKAFFLKLKADYLRYIAEVQTGNGKTQTTEETLSLYREAQDIVKIHLSAIHHTRLGLALNFSVFYADIMNSFENALILATEAIQDAMKEVDKLDEDLNKDCAAIVELIQGNIKLWNNIVDERDKHGDNEVPVITTGSTKVND